MSYFLRFLPWVQAAKWYAVAGAFALTLTGWGAQTWRLHTAQAHLAEAKTAKAELEKRIASAALEATQKYRAEEQRRTAALQGIVDDTIKTATAVAADAAAARDSHLRLLQRVRALISGGRPSSDPQAAAGSATAEGAGLLLTNLFGESDQRSGQLAQYADQARTAGLACERSYDSLTEKK